MVEWATLPRQRVVAGTLDNLPGRVSAADIHAPATVIIGGVVTLREKLAWFEGQHSTDETGVDRRNLL
jgi:uroporphyrin-III C-methyltransferase/precorrin-2 dehydrogenase/sirohydrochlorin ferrochelatase